MSYYNFNDHFWSPKKVCSQSKDVKKPEKTNNKKIILAMFSLGFIAVSVPLLLPLLTARNDQQGKVFLNNFGDKCLVVRREPVQVYCSTQ
jgi:hypothetical protein